MSFIAEGGERRFHAKTSADGRYSASLPIGRYAVHAVKVGYVTAEYGQARWDSPGSPIEIKVGIPMENIDLRLHRAAVIVGSIFDENGHPFIGCRVEAVSTDDLLTLATDYSDDRGSFRLYGLPATDFYVRLSITIEHPEFRGSSGPVYVPNSSTLQNAKRISLKSPGDHSIGRIVLNTKAFQR